MHDVAEPGMVNPTDAPGRFANTVDVVELLTSLLAKLTFGALQPPVMMVAGPAFCRPANPLFGWLVAPMATEVAAKTSATTMAARKILFPRMPIPPFLGRMMRQAARLRGVTPQERS